MSKATVITDTSGKILAVGHGHLSEGRASKSKSNEDWAGIRALPGQKLHEIELADDLTTHKSFKAIVEKIRPHLKS